MTFCNQPAFAAPLGGAFRFLRHGLAALRLESRPIKRKRRRVEQLRELFGPAFGLLQSFTLILAARERNKIKGSRAEQKLVAGLLDRHFPMRKRRSISVQ